MLLGPCGRVTRGLNLPPNITGNVEDAGHDVSSSDGVAWVQTPPCGNARRLCVWESFEHGMEDPYGMLVGNLASGAVGD